MDDTPYRPPTFKKLTRDLTADAALYVQSRWLNVVILPTVYEITLYVFGVVLMASIMFEIHRFMVQLADNKK